MATIVGLDIGKETIRAVELENAEKARPTVLRFHEVPVPEGAVRSGEVRELHTVTAAIKRLWSAGGFKSKDVVIGMGNQRVLARELTVPKMGLTQIRESLPFQVQDMLPVPVADALLDFYPISEGVGEQGPVVNGLLVAAIKESVLANVSAVQQAGLKPVHVDLIPFALSRVLIRGAYARGTVAIVDIGASTTHIVVTSNGVPQFVRMIPAGGEDITRAIAGRLDVSDQQAEAIKRARGLSTAPVASEQERAAAEQIHASALELLNSVRNTLNYFANSRQNEPIQAIVLAGGGSNLIGLAQALGDTTRIQVIPSDAFATVDQSRLVKGTTPEAQQAMIVALGLAMGSAA